MPYQITHANGTILVTLQDLTIDTSSTSLALLGREIVNYGEIIAQNFVYLLENFAGPATADLSSGPPRNPLSGQLWYHTTVPVNG